MKKKIFNEEKIEGRVYQHNLQIKTVQNKDSKNYGTEFITGTLDVATDEEGLNIVSTHYTYITEMTGSGKKNVTFGVLKSIIEGAKTWVVDGKDAALKIRLTPALALNDFYTEDGQLVSAKRNEGGFANVITTLSKEDDRSTFHCDMLITSVNRIEADEDNNIPEDYLTIKGAIFNFKNDILPMEFVCRREDGMSYFESLDASPSNPVFTEVRGQIVATTIEREIKEESAFGSAMVKKVPRNLKEWRINWARPVEYAFGEEDTITVEEIQKALQEREVYLAALKILSSTALECNIELPSLLSITVKFFMYGKSRPLYSEYPFP